MIIVTAADKEFEKYALGLKDSAEKHGYKVRVFDLDDLGWGEKFHFDPSGLKDGLVIDNIRYIPKCQFKPELVKYVLRLTEDNVVWMDSDAWIKRPIDAVFDDDFDVAVTMRRQHEINQDSFSHVSGYLNAGVIFFKNTENAQRFADMWVDEMPNTTAGSDQEALNRVVKQATDLTEYNKVFDLDGIKIKVLKTDDYNNFYFSERQDDAKILHFKGSFKRLYDQYTR